MLEKKEFFGLGEEYEKLFFARLRLQEFMTQHSISFGESNLHAGQKVERASEAKLIAAVEGNCEVDEMIKTIENFKEDTSYQGIKPEDIVYE